MSVAGAIGLDFGSSTAVLAVAKKGGVEILTNEGSHRETQSIVGFGENERFIGEAGAVQLKSNFKNTIVYPNRLLGLKANNSLLEQETKFLYSKTVPNAENKVTFEVKYRSETKVFLPEQIVAMLLQKFKQIVKRAGVQHNDLVISVPGYYTDVERKAMLDAAKIAEVNVLKLMNETSAIALGYGIFRRTEFDSTPRNVAFVDFGHSHLSVFIAGFTKDKLTILNQVHERNLGARDLDWALLEHYADLFNKQNGLNPKKSDKAKLRLLDAIEKQRKVLSANSDSTINIEYLMEDCDLNQHLTREQFEELIAPVVARVKQTLQRVLDKDIPLHSIEIVGGATRIPIIQRVIQEVFKVETISKTLNASECIARGCAIQAAMLSPLFKVADYGIEESGYYPIRCAWTFIDEPGVSKDAKMEVEGESKNNPQKQTSILFDRNCPIPNVKSITFHREESVDFKLFYDPVPEGFDPLVAHFLIHNQKPKEIEYGIKLRVHLNRNSVVEFESAQLIEDYYEEVLATQTPETTQAQNSTTPTQPGQTGAPNSTSAQDAQKEQELKKKKKSKSTILKADVAPVSGYPQQIINRFYEEECQMAHQDKIIHETYDKKNELESYIYDIRGKLNEKYSEYALSDVKEKLFAALSQAESWLYQDGAKAAKNAYVSRIEELRKLGDPITKRFNEFSNIPEAINNFLNTLKGYEQIVLSNDPNLEHITPQERQPVLTEIEKQRGWLAKVAQALGTLRKDQDPTPTSADINLENEKFINAAKPIINKPKPVPKAEPKKAEPQANGQQNEGGANTQAPTTETDKKDGEKMDIEK